MIDQGTINTICQRIADLEVRFSRHRHHVDEAEAMTLIPMIDTSPAPVAAVPADQLYSDADVRVIAASILAALRHHAAGDYESSAHALAEDIVERRLIGVWAYPDREHPAVTIAALRAKLKKAQSENERRERFDKWHAQTLGDLATESNTLAALLRDAQRWAAVEGPFTDGSEPMWERIDAALAARKEST